MNDIFDDMFDKADALKNVSVEGSKSLGQLVSQVDVIDDDIAQLKDKLSKKTNEKQRLVMELIPDLLDEMGITKNIEVKGLSVGRRFVVGASIPSIKKEMNEQEIQECIAKREQCFSWLREKGFEHKIKNDVTVTFKVGEDNLAGDLVGLLQEKGFNPTRKIHVESATLKATLREYHQGTKTREPQTMSTKELDLFNAFIANSATVKRTV